MENLKYGITPNDVNVCGECDSDSIQNAVDFAHETGVGKVVIPAINERTGGNVWDITETILLPDDITIVLDNCRLRLADGVFCNVFRNKNVYTELGKTLSGEQKNIKIIGIGNAVLDGGIPNGLTEHTSNTKNYPHIRNNNFILFSNVRNFEIKGIKAINQRWWAFNFLYCSDGRISDIDIYAADNIENQDGIDIRCGCNNIIIENISGQAGDDLVALTALKGKSETEFKVCGKEWDVHTVIIKNIVGTSVSKAIVALRNQDGVKLHDVVIDGVTDTSTECGKNHPYATVRIGQNAYVQERPSMLGETYNINVSNIHSSCDSALMVGATLLNASFRNIFVSGTAPCAFTVNEGANVENILIDGVFYNVENYKLYTGQGKNDDVFRNDCGDKFAIFNFNNYGSKFLQGPDNSKNVHIKNVYVKKWKRDLLSMP